jgi:hypothetical protein
MKAGGWEFWIMAFRDPFAAGVALPRGLLGFEARVFVAAVAERLVFRLATPTKIERRELIFLILLTLVVEQFGSAFHLIGTVFRYTNYYISHSVLLLIG